MTHYINKAGCAILDKDNEDKDLSKKTAVVINPTLNAVSTQTKNQSKSRDNLSLFPSYLIKSHRERDMSVETIKRIKSYLAKAKQQPLYAAPRALPRPSSHLTKAHRQLQDFLSVFFEYLAKIYRQSEIKNRQKITHSVKAYRQLQTCC
ncbi:MAG: hypothetical protein LBT96_01990 [Campylobacteraceae bacterium]|jgi:hypothetical protein|nr:hypothetical protein [Campylobacteraceae bacterium]